MRTLIAQLLGAAFLFVSASLAQNPVPQAAKPDQHVLGTIVTVDPASHRITVKEDKTGTAYAISLEKTRTLLKVQPGAKDLKTAARITANDLAAGDRVDIRGYKAEDTPTSIAAASLILMSARELQQARQAEMNDWRQRGIAGTVTYVDAAGLKFNINVRTAEGPQSLIVHVSSSAQLTRYSPENPKTPVASKLADIQPGDQVRVLGDKTADGSAITAERVYSGSFRTVAGTISSIGSDGNEITVTDLQTKQSVQVVLTTDSAIRKLPPQMAMMLARRLNPSVRQPESATGGSNSPAGTPSLGAKAGEAEPGSSSGANGMSAARSGDISQIIERLPKIAIADLKSGDAVVVSGAAGNDKSQLVATNIIAGVEPIFQSAPPRRGRSPGGDWNLDTALPAQ
jgi:hypothetical protein